MVIASCCRVMGGRIVLERNEWLAAERSLDPLSRGLRNDTVHYLRFKVRAHART